MTTQDVSTPDDDSNPNAVPQAPDDLGLEAGLELQNLQEEINEQAAAGKHLMDQAPETQAIAESAVTTEQVGTLDGFVNALIDGTIEARDEGLALLKTTAQAVESEGRKIVALVEHAIEPVGVGPRTVEAARDLPFAAPGETLFEAGEHLLFRAFRDVGDEVRHIYLNEFGNHVKA